MESPSQRRHHTGVGVLILTNCDGRPHVLLGRETFKSFIHNGEYVIPMYEEFGGGIQRKNVSLEENALSELDEETCHVFNWTDPNILKRRGFKYIDIPFKHDRKYRMFIIYIHDVTDAMNLFRHNYTQIAMHPSIYYKKRNFLEMDDLKLISLDEIKHKLYNPEQNIYNFHNHRVLCINEDTYISRRLVVLFTNLFKRDTHTPSPTPTPTTPPTPTPNTQSPTPTTPPTPTQHTIISKLYSMMANVNKDDEYNGYTCDAEYMNLSSAEIEHGAANLLTGIDICYKVFNNCYIAAIYDKPPITLTNPIYNIPYGQQYHNLQQQQQQQNGQQQKLHPLIEQMFKSLSTTTTQQPKHEPQHEPVQIYIDCLNVRCIGMYMNLKYNFLVNTVCYGVGV